MKLLLLLLLTGCTCQSVWGPDPYPWLHSRRYEPYSMVMIPPPTIGDADCPMNWVGWKVEAKRFAVPEEHCAYIRSKLLVCCPAIGRNACHGWELEATCVKDKTQEKESD